MILPFGVINGKMCHLMLQPEVDAEDVSRGLLEPVVVDDRGASNRHNHERVVHEPGAGGGARLRAARRDVFGGGDRSLGGLGNVD